MKACVQMSRVQIPVYPAGLEQTTYGSRGMRSTTSTTAAVILAYRALDVKRRHISSPKFLFHNQNVVNVWASKCFRVLEFHVAFGFHETF